MGDPFRNNSVPPDRTVASLGNSVQAGVHSGAHLIVVDSEVSLLDPEVPLYNCPTLKPYKELEREEKRNGS